MSKVIRKVALYTIAMTSPPKRYVRMYWSWYQQENEQELLNQLTQIIEEDDDDN
jgi:hypothetical protein